VTFILIHSDSFCLHFPQFSHVRRVGDLRLRPTPPIQDKPQLVLDKVGQTPACLDCVLNAARSHADGCTADGKVDRRGQNRRGKATETEQFIAALLSYSTAEAAAEASVKTT
jgi:hypothetical protein